MAGPATAGATFFTRPWLHVPGPIAVTGPAAAMGKGHVPGPIATGQEHETHFAIAIGKKKTKK